MTKVKVRQELLWMIISGYKHEKRNIMYLSKTEMGKEEMILEVCELHKRFCISTCELLSKV